MEFRADMHSHTNCSDGMFSPLELIELAKSQGLSALSITDHDSIQAYTQESFAKASSLGLLLCTGVEFSCQIKGVNIHILGYDFDVENKEIQELCQKHKTRRFERNRKILYKLRTQGILIEERELEEFKGIVSSVKEAFNKYLGDGKCCFDAGVCFSISDTIKVIHKAGGKAFIAHPHLIKRNKILKEVLSLPFDGIECFYGVFSRRDNNKWLEIAKDKNWLISGGSDFHGDSKPQNRMGSSWIDQENFFKIYEKNKYGLV
jgi:predicted metal-dependent phosphoesterase TrpH